MKNKIIANFFVSCFMLFTLGYIALSSADDPWYNQFLLDYSNTRETVEGGGAEQNVIKVLRKHYLRPPPLQSFNLSYPVSYDPSQGQSRAIRNIFRNKTDGIFVECGAVDGVFLSNTLYLERALHWRGLLIEPDENSFKELSSHRRNAYISKACLSVTERATVQTFRQVKRSSKRPWWFKGISKLEGIGKSFIGSDFTKYSTVTKVQCFPFFTYMLALNIKSIDYFSLDVEGAELNILKTIPFDKVEIKVISVEWLHHDQREKELELFLISKGYSELKQSKNLNWHVVDKIFIKNGIQL